MPYLRLGTMSVPPARRRAAPPPRLRSPGGARRRRARSSCHALLAGAPGAALAQELQDAVRIEGELPDPDPARVVDGVGDGGDGRVQGSWAGVVGAVRGVGDLALDDARVQLRRIHRGGD